MTFIEGHSELVFTIETGFASDCPSDAPELPPPPTPELWRATFTDPQAAQIFVRWLDVLAQKSFRRCFMERRMLADLKRSANAEGVAIELGPVAPDEVEVRSFGTCARTPSSCRCEVLFWIDEPR